MVADLRERSAAMLDRGNGRGPAAAILLAAMLLSCAPPVALSAESWCNLEDEDPDSKWYWRVDEYPHPLTQPRYCNRYRPSFVCDPDRVMSKKQADALDGIIERIRNETLCICPTCGKSHARGITLGVAIMEHVHRANNQPVEEAVRVFAETLRKNWNLGNCDDDILLLISTKDTMSTTLVGPAVSGVFPQEVADQIYLESRGHFSNCNFYLGLESMVQSYFDMLRRLQLKGLVGARVQPSAGASAGVIVGIVFGALAGLLLAVAAVLLVVRRCDAPAISRKSIPEAWRRVRNLRTGARPGAQQSSLHNNNTKAPPPAAAVPYRIKVPAAGTVASEMAEVTVPLTSGLLLPPPPPSTRTPPMSNGRYEVPTGGRDTPGGLDPSDTSDSSDDERSTTDSDDKDCSSCCSSTDDVHENTPAVISSSAETRVTV
ncbi:uncharacterized protein LOC119400180 [Rhipicephalus sanguineus]|uniref:uncharacterized protein LOC119400180 n=1 Tax=Rhipicephalus sanguineus TaxID=34632 RepID=UPI00189593DE|nr:uncharacterized protein LOC119400180 [Rhipicephalus sanguineus]